jgi:hypothetical protein
MRGTLYLGEKAVNNEKFKQPTGVTLAERSPYYLPPTSSKRLERVLAFVVLVLLVVAYTQPVEWRSKLAFLIIASSALLPLWLWIRGVLYGLPIYPAFAAGFLFTYATPLLSDFDKVKNFSPEQHLRTSFIVAGFLLIGLLVYFKVLKRRVLPSMTLRVFDDNIAQAFCFLMLGLGIFYRLAILGQWISVSAGYVGVIERSLSGLIVLAVFAYAYRLGAREIGRSSALIFYLFLTTYVFCSTTNLYLLKPLVVILSLILGLSLGRKKFPLLLFLFVVAISAVLHHGKGEMRSKYWGEIAGGAQVVKLQPDQIVPFYTEWVYFGLDDLRYGDSWEREALVSDWKLLQRMTLVDMFLLVESKKKSGHPMLSGATYSKILLSLVPRFIFPGKASPHHGNDLLSKHYGYGDNVSIAWGILPEANANFGLVGMIALAIALAAIQGMVVRWSAYSPILSFRSLVSVLFLLSALEPNWTLETHVNVIFKTFLILLIGAALFSRRKILDPALDAATDVQGEKERALRGTIPQRLLKAGYARN